VRGEEFGVYPRGGHSGVGENPFGLEYRES
jgi:hypothetical protein